MSDTPRDVELEALRAEVSGLRVESLTTLRIAALERENAQLREDATRRVEALTCLTNAGLRQDAARLREALVGVATGGVGGNPCWCPQGWAGPKNHTLACSHAWDAFLAMTGTP